MEKFFQITLILCLIGFLREMRPSEPFVTEFLSSTEWRNVTTDELNRQVYPVGTYSYLALLFVVFLITDMLRYKLIIIFAAGIGIAVYSILLWTSSLLGLQMSQVLYGAFMSAEVAYYTYIYAKVDRSKYQRVTSYARAAALIGRFSAGVLGQLLYSSELMNLRQLNYITLAAQALSLPLGILLPGVGASLYFYRTTNSSDNNSVKQMRSNEPIIDSAEVKFSMKHAGSLLWKHFTESYSNLKIVESSLWWSLAMAGFIQIQTYVQILWQVIDEDRQNLYNGAVEGVLTLFGAFGALLAGKVNMKFYEKFRMWILAACSVVEGALIITSAFTNNVIVAYAMYISFGILYSFMITLVTAHVAKQLSDDSFGLIFGINTFLALLFQTLLTVVFVTETGFELSPRDQFLTYAVYFLALSVVCAFTAVIKPTLTCSVNHCRNDFRSS